MGQPQRGPAAAELDDVFFFAPTVVALFAIRGLYQRSLNRSFLDELPKIEALTSVAAMLLLSGWC